MSESRLKKIIRSFASIFAVSTVAFFVLTNLVFAAGALDQNNQFNSLKILSRKQAFLLLNDQNHNLDIQALLDAGSKYLNLIQADFLSTETPPPFLIKPSPQSAVQEPLDFNFKYLNQAAAIIAENLHLPNQEDFFSGHLSLTNFDINPEDLVSKVIQKTEEIVAPFQTDFLSPDAPSIFTPQQTPPAISENQKLIAQKIIGKIQSLGFNSQPKSFSSGLSLPDFAINPGQLVQKIFQQTGEVTAPFRTNFLAPGEPSIFLIKQTPPLITEEQKAAAKTILEKIKSLFGLSFFFSKEESQMVNSQLNNNQIDEKLINLLVSRISAKLPQLQQVIKETRVETQTQIKETKTLVDQEKIQELANLLAALQAKEESDRQALFQSIALSNRINSLSGVTISNPTFAAGSITDADVPDTITASNYLPLAGGIISGTLKASSTFQVTGDSHFYGALTVDGATNLGSIVVSNSVISNDLTVGGNAYINGGNLNLGTGSATTTLTSAGGKLGIGSTSPAQLLGVHGNVFISGDIANVANITATGTLSVNNASTTGMLTVGNGLISQASSTFSSNLSATGQFNASSSIILDSQTVSYLKAATTTIINNRVNAFSFATSTTGNPLLSFNTAVNNGVVVIGTTTVSSVNVGSAKFYVNGDSVFDVTTFGPNSGRISFSGNNSVGAITLSSSGGSSIFQMFDAGLVELDTIANEAMSFLTNNTERARFTSAGLFGIATNTPSQLLSVQGNALISGNITSVANITATGTLNVTGTTTLTGGLLSTGSTTISSILNISGPLNASSSLLATFIAIGTTTPPATNSGINLAVQGNVLFSGNLNAANITATGTLSIATSSPSATVNLAVNGGALISGTTTVGGLISTSTALLATNGGNVGIGTTNPTAPLHVVTTGSTLATFESTGQQAPGFILKGSDRSVTLNPQFNGGSALQTTSFWAARDGSSISGISNQMIELTNSNSTVFFGYIGGDVNNNLVINQASGNSKNLLLIAQGNVGIGGTTSPYAKLSITSSSTATTTFALVPILGQNANLIDIYSPNGTLNSVLTASSSLGIGTTSPSQLLSVQGNAFFSGNLTNVANITATGTLNVTGTTTLTGGLLSTGSTTISSILNISGPLNASSSLLATFIAIGTTTPPATNSGINLAVQGNVLFSGNLNLASLVATSSIGIGSTTPYGFLTIQSQIGTVLPLVTVASSSGDSFFSISSTGTTTIQTLKTGTLTFDTNAGVVPWVDLPINSFAATNSVQSYSALLNGSTTLTVWGQSAGTPQGISVITNQKVGVGSSTPWGILSVERTDATTSPIFVVSSMSTGTPFFIVANNGNIGIATATPWGMLSIDRTIATTAPLFVVSNESTTTPYFIIANNGYVGIGTTSPGFLLSVAGNIGTTQCVKSATSTFGIGPADCTDIAESYVAGEDLEPGDIVALGDGSPLRLVKATSNSKTILGAVSGHPAVLFEGSMSSFGAPAVQSVYQSGDKAPLALAGRILVKVNLDNGPIQAGDPIAASSEAGIGQKASTSGMIIGYALEDYSGPTDQNNSEVLIIASLQNWNPPVKVTSDVQNIGGNAGTSEVQNIAAIIIDTVKSWLADMKVTIEDGLVTLKNLVAETITANQLELKDKATGDFYCVTINNGELEKTLGKCGQ